MRRSAAWILSIVTVLTFIMGAIIFTATDPFMQALFDSALWSSETSWGSDALSWQKSMWAFMPMAVLIMMLFMVWIRTRQPT